MPQKIMTYKQFQEALNNKETINTYSNSRTILTIDRLNEFRAVVGFIFFERNDEPKTFRKRIDAVMTWEEAWRVLDAFKTND